jgi:hypothetical protein
MLVSGYTFNHTTGVLNFSGVSGFDIRLLRGIVNATRGAIIYAPGLSGHGYTSLASGNVLDLEFDTTTHADDDVLLVFYDPAKQGPSGKSPVTGAFSGAGQNSAVFTPIEGRGFNITLYGTFVGTVVLQRSTDGGTTWLPVTAGGVAIYSWTAPGSESAEESQSGVQYRLTCSAWTSGAPTYRISQ